MKPGATLLPDIVDAQVHIEPHFGEAVLLSEMQALGIRSVLLEEFWGFDAHNLPLPHALLPGGQARPLSPLATAAAARLPERFAFVQRVNGDDPDIANLISSLALTPGCRGLRFNLFDPQTLVAFQNGHFDEVLREARRHDFAVGILAKDAGSALRATLDRFPDQRFVIDHCGWPRGPMQWEQVLALSTLPNVWLKWSHARRAFRGANPTRMIRSELGRAIQYFGRERVMWASDVTQDAAHLPWADLLADVRDVGLSPNDLEWVLARSARVAYCWPSRGGD